MVFSMGLGKEIKQVKSVKNYLINYINIIVHIQMFIETYIIMCIVKCS